MSHKPMSDDTQHIEIEHTADGSATLYVPALDEHYHSVKGALTEAQHIYRDCAFRHRSDGTPLRLLEIGFGTGLNAVVTAMASNASCPVHYITLEKHPLAPHTLAHLRHETYTSPTLLAAIHDAPWGVPTAITPHFTLEKRQADYLVDPLPEAIDIVYFDAFAPEKQPEMWSEQAFKRLYNVLNPQATLTTYCAKGHIRRLLATLGFTVERIPGPTNGKREILRARKPL